ncbi:MAG: HAMP domain-containing histidine kinase [Oscillospiraceae bacterium]|nr:HAMP domain-containing histidine kinase [Oscillospiraceae bacterium]
MKLKSKKRGGRADYSKIKRRLYLYILIAVIAAVAFVVLLRQLLRGVAGNFIVELLIRGFHLDRQAAMRIYQYTVRNNLEILIYAAVALCFFLLCRIIFSNFMRYFDEVNDGIDALIRGGDAQIELSAEMAFMEQKLNALKRTLEKREQDAKLAERRKNDLVIYLAHDIKTPLTSVVGYLSLLDEAPDMPAEQKARYAHIALDKAYRLERLIDEFFEITRYNLQAITLSKKDFDLYYMLVQMTDEFYPQLSANGKRAAVRASENLTIYGDPDKLARVFNNILKNAIAYSPDNSVIDITAAISGGTATIVFSNAGSIPKDKLASIFDKFYRLDSARSSDTGGAGLGLAIAKEIVVSHGGRIYADSDGKQTSFTVELPVAP